MVWFNEPFQISFQFHSNKMAVPRVKKLDKSCGISDIEIVAASPEKAGVGGSIPSLATTLSSPTFIICLAQNS